jgi:hypothetical protein
LHALSQPRACPMPIRFTCPNPQCGKTIVVKDEFAGRTGKCPGCATPVKIPAAMPAFEVVEDEPPLPPPSKKKAAVVVVEEAEEVPPPKPKKKPVIVVDEDDEEVPTPKRPDRRRGGRPQKTCRPDLARRRRTRTGEEVEDTDHS